MLQCSAGAAWDTCCLDFLTAPFMSCAAFSLKNAKEKSECVPLFAKGISMNGTDSLTSRFNADLTDITFFLLTSAALTVSLVVKQLNFLLAEATLVAFYLESMMPIMPRTHVKDCMKLAHMEV